MHFYPSEWLSGIGTMAMSAEQCGAFVNLLAHSWAAKPPCSLPNDDKTLAKWSKVSAARWVKIGTLVRQQLVACADGRLRNPKQVAVWLGMMGRRTKTILGANKTNQKRWGRSLEAIPEIEIDSSLRAQAPVATATAAATATAEESKAHPEVLAAVSAVPWRVAPSEQIILSWVQLYGAEHILETIENVRARLPDTHYNYLDSILADRRKKTSVRPAGKPKPTARDFGMRSISDLDAGRKV